MRRDLCGVIGPIPYRMAFAGGWIDQPFVSRLNPEPPFNFPAEFGLSWILPRIVGLTHANDLLLSSRVFSAEEAMAMGFLNKVLPPHELMAHVTAYAKNLAETVAPGSARETKHQTYRDLHRDAATAVAEAERLLEDMIRHPDYGEGVKAWMQKRPPAWRG